VRLERKESDYMSLADRLKDIDVTQLRLKNGMTMEQILRQEAERLKQCIQNRIDEFYDNHDPSGEYERTFAFQQSLTVDDVLEIDIENNKLKIYLLFDDDLAYHPSLWGGNLGFVPALIYYGWSWKNDTIHRRYFSYFEGFDYLGLGIQDYEQNNPYGIIIDYPKRT